VSAGNFAGAHQVLLHRQCAHQDFSD